MIIVGEEFARHGIRDLLERSVSRPRLLAGRSSATLAGLGIAWHYVRLALANPQLSLVKLSQQLLDTWGGKLIGVLYAWYAFHLVTIVHKNLEELTVTATS